MLAKFGLPKIVAMETVTDSFFFFNGRYLSRGLIYCLEILLMCAPGAKGTVYVQNIFSSDLQIFSYNAANFQRWSCGCTGLKQCLLPEQF